MADQKPISQEDARRIQSTQDTKKGGGDEGFKSRTSSAADKGANDKKGKDR